MFEYHKFLEFPVKVKNPNPKLANIVITQYGGPNGKYIWKFYKYTLFFYY